MASTLDYLLASKFKTAREKQIKAVQEAAERQAKKKSRFGGFLKTFSPLAGLGATQLLNFIVPGAGILALALKAGVGSYIGSQLTESVGKDLLGYGPESETSILEKLQGERGKEGDIGYGSFDPEEYAKTIGGSKEFYDDIERSQRFGALTSALTAGAGAYTKGADWLGGSSPDSSQFFQINPNESSPINLGVGGGEASSLSNFNVVGTPPQPLTKFSPVQFKFQEGGRVPIPVRDGRQRQKGTINYYSLY